MLGGVRRVDGEPARSGPVSAGQGYGAPRRGPRRPDGADPRYPHDLDDKPGGRHLRRADDDGEEEDDDDGPLLSRRGNPRRTRKQRVILGVLIAVALVAMAAAGVAGYALKKYESIDRVSDIKIAEAPAGEPQNFLLVGSDTREGTADAGEVAGKRSDTIMVLRVDPESDRLSLTSFPRDLIVDIPATGRTGMINSAYSLPNGEQALIDTINQNFGIPINHYVEVDFEGFKQLVDAVGGVPMYFSNAVRDRHSGLFIEQLGCVTLQGQQALEFTRSRYLDYMTPEGWERDPQSDPHRAQRQQVFIRRAMTKALAEVKSNPLRLQQLVDIGVGNIRLDDQMGVGDILNLAEHFRDFSSDRLETYALPVLPHPDNDARLVLDESEAEPILNVFRGLDPGEVSPGAVTVQVVNGTDKDGFANDISGALQAVGFDLMDPTSSDERPPHSIAYHAPGQANFAQRVARHVTGGADVVEKPGLTPGTVELLVGADFSTVHDQPTPLDQMPTTTVAPAGGGAPATTAPATTAPPTTAPPPTTTTVPNGYIVGEPPPGHEC
jgi:LCP family protein required for cell wall assembly